MIYQFDSFSAFFDTIRHEPFLSAGERKKKPSHFRNRSETAGASFCRHTALLCLEIRQNSCGKASSSDGQFSRYPSHPQFPNRFNAPSGQKSNLPLGGISAFKHAKGAALKIFNHSRQPLFSGQQQWKRLRVVTVL